MLCADWLSKHDVMVPNRVGVGHGQKISIEKSQSVHHHTAPEVAQKHPTNDLIEFSRNYTKLAMLSFLYCFVVKGKLI